MTMTRMDEQKLSHILDSLKTVDRSEIMRILIEAWELGFDVGWNQGEHEGYHTGFLHGNEVAQ